MSFSTDKDSIYIRRRMEMVMGLMGLALSILFIRAIDLHVLQSAQLKDMATRQHFHQYHIPAPRGAILDRQGRILSKSIEVPSIGAIAEEIPSSQIKPLAKALGISNAKLRAKLAKRKGFTWLARQVSPDTAQKVAALHIAGVRQEHEWRRYHPLGPETGHILGFVGIDGHGLEGVEYSMDKRLQGNDGIRLVQRDAKGQSLPGGVWLQQPHQGQELRLTIDSNIQSLAYAALTDGIRKQRAKGGSVVVMDPRNGDILAMASWPGFNPNNFSQYSARQWRNRAITDMFEPGSTIKPFTVASALESEHWQENSRIYCEKGSFRIADHIIHDDHAEGWLDLTGLIARSSNIGAAKLAINLGAEKLHHSLAISGFGTRTGIALSGESPGILMPQDKWGAVETANIAFGQGIAVTPLQLASAFSILANQGVKVQPHLFMSKQMQQSQRIFSAETAQSVNRMLIAATGKNGTGFRAVPAGYQVAGKTGTAQKPTKQGSYSKEKFTAVFAGFAPAQDPRIVIIVVVDEPQKSIYGGTTAAPIFRNIAATALPYLGVLPSMQAATDWQVQQASSVTEQVIPTGSVASFKGLSLRQANHLAEQQGYALQTHGSGWVTRQKPVALATLPRRAQVEVWLHE